MSAAPPRKLISSGEWLTLAGMALVVISAALTWSREVPRSSSAAVAAYVSTHSFKLAGYDLSLGPLRVGWVVVICAVICGALMLFDPSPREKRAFQGVQIAMALVIFAVAALHLGPHPGVILAIIGAVALVAGAEMRYRS